MNLPFAGGCLCGGVRYECHAHPLAMHKCHCRDCQQMSGGAYAPVVVVLWQAFKLTNGTLRHYTTARLNGRPNLRGFCGQCGSQLTVGEDSERDRLGLMAANLDAPEWFNPAMEIFVCDAQPWDLMDGNLPKHPQYAPRQETTKKS